MTIKNTGDCIWGLERAYRKEPFTSELLVGIQLSFRLSKKSLLCDGFLVPCTLCPQMSQCPHHTNHQKNWCYCNWEATGSISGKAGTWMSMENELLSACSLRSPLRRICVRKLRGNLICGSSLLEIDGRLCFPILTIWHTLTNTVFKKNKDHYGIV